VLAEPTYPPGLEAERSFATHHLILHLVFLPGDVESCLRTIRSNAKRSAVDLLTLTGEAMKRVLWTGITTELPGNMKGVIGVNAELPRNMLQSTPGK
jgi:hypothetical protein